MFYLSKPTSDQIEVFLAIAELSEISYGGVGATQNETPPIGCTVDHSRISIGRGDLDWEAARRAIRNWRMFDLGWVELHRPATPIAVGENVAVMIKHFGFYSLNAARIVYIIDEPDRFGFAYGTLTEHAESGEERFLVQRDLETGEIWYDIYAFSRPNFTAKLGYPLIRVLQKCFAADSKSAMARAINSSR